MLTRNQSRTETVLEQLLTRITEMSNPVQTNSRSQTHRPTSPIHEQDRDTPDSTATNVNPSHRYSKKLPDPTPLSDGKDPTFLS
jgi:hypothetical protein